jgi:hypothetical protein
VGGVGSGGKRLVAPRRRTLPRKFKPGVVSRLDQRSAVARELMADFAAIVDVHKGGIDNLTPLDRMLIESLVFANAWRRRMEQAAVDTKTLDVPKYAALVDRVHGIAKTVGLKRVMKDVPSLAAIAQESKPK